MKQVKLETIEQTAVIRLDNGPANSISTQLVRDLQSAIDHARDRCRSAVLAGNDKFFCIGLNLPELLEFSRDEMMIFWTDFEDLVLSIYSLPIPTVCAMKGHTTAGGAILSLACDFRIMATGRKLIGLNEVKLGVPVPFLADLILRQTVSDRVAVELEYSGEFIDSSRARSVGLVDEICDQQEVENLALETAARLASVPENAFARTKENRTHDLVQKFKSSRTARSSAFMDCWFSESTRELLKGAAEKI